MQMRNFLIWAVVIVLVLALFQLMDGPQQTTAPQSERSYSEFLDQVERGGIRNATIQGDTVIAETSSGTNIRVTLPPQDTQTVGILRQSGVNIQVEEENTEGNFLLNMLMSWFPFLLLIGVWIFFMRQMQGGGRGKCHGLSESPRPSLLTEKQGRVTFDDVAGVDEAKQELEESRRIPQGPDRNSSVWAVKFPKGALARRSAPGTGKTLIARAVAGEASVPFFTISGSDFVEMFVGVGASPRPRHVRTRPRKNAPCIIFIDEIDAVGRSIAAPAWAAATTSASRPSTNCWSRWTVSRRMRALS